MWPVTASRQDPVMGGAEPALSIRLDHPWSASCPDPESRAAPSWVPPLPAASSWPALHWPAGLNAVSSLLWAHSLPKPAEGGEGRGRCLVTLCSRRPRLTVGEKYSQASRVCTPKRACPKKSTVYARIYMEFRKMVTMTLYERQQKRHRCKEQIFGLGGRR